MQLLTNGVSMWQRRSLLLKLSEQTQLLEELAEISVDRLGTITSAADGRCNWYIYHVVLYSKRNLAVLIFKYCMYNSYQATKRALQFKESVVWSCLLFFFFFLTVLPGLAERPLLMTLWSECSGSAGLFHTTLDRVFRHMNKHYTAALQETDPHSADKG